MSKTKKRLCFVFLRLKQLLTPLFDESHSHQILFLVEKHLYKCCLLFHGLDSSLKVAKEC